MRAPAATAITSSGSSAGNATDTVAAVPLSTPAPLASTRTTREPAPTTTRKHIYAREDNCTWQQTQVLCGEPRSCYDCLNVPLASGEACTITADGICASLRKYDYTLDYRLNYSLSSVRNYFPSTNTTYCESTDTACALCRASVFKESTDGRTNASQFCVGDRGCVCVGFCESTVWKPVAVDMTCERSSAATTLPPTTIVISDGRVALTGPLRTVALIFVALITVPVVLIVGGSVRARYLRERARRQARQARLDARAPPLVLTGWKALQQELIANEHEAFATQELDTSTPVVVSGRLDPVSLAPPEAGAVPTPRGSQ